MFRPHRWWPKTWNRKPSRKAPQRKLQLCTLEDRTVPATFVVTTTADTGAGSLRNQVIAANANPGVDAVIFDSEIFNALKTITLTSGEISVTGDLTITGPTNKLTISGNNTSRIFNVNNAVTGTAINVTLNDLTLTKGVTSGSNDGGAIFVQDENLTLSNCLLTANSSADTGGAIRLEAAGAKLTINASTLSSNTAISGGGAISAVNAPTVLIVDSTFTGNTAVAGGAMNMFQGGSLTITGSTFAFNFATTSDGGALFLNGTFTTNLIRNSTFGGNQAGSDGGAIAISSSFGPTLGLQNSTLVSNLAINDNGGAIARTGGTGLISVVSTIVANNSAGALGEDIFTTGTVTGQSALIETTGGITTKNFDATTTANVGKDPQLGGLANNGGPTLTLKPAITSPVIDSGVNLSGISTDQRGTGFFRQRGSAVDIGAVEVEQAFVVTNTNNSGSGSLRQAVLDANDAIGADTIVFNAGNFSTAKTITLTSGELAITDSLDIVGPAVNVTVSGNNASRVFNIDDDAGTTKTVSMSNLRITAGNAAAGDGGGILNRENLSLTNCAITNSSAGANGGGILATNGTLTLTSCTVAGNTAGTQGGGITVSAETLNVLSTTISGNSALTNGGGIFTSGSLLTVRNSTISSNTAASGGGIHFFNTFTNSIANSTITANSATTGGGLKSAPGTLNIDSTIISGNTGSGGADISHTGTTNVNASAIGSSSGFSTTGTGNLAFGSNLLLGPLSDNGGPTLTHAPAAGSPVFGKGSNLFGLAVDQRGTGFGRARSGSVDIGAVEVNQFIVTNTNNSGAGSLRQALIDTNVIGVSQGPDTITFSALFDTPQTIKLTTGLLNYAGEGGTIFGPAGRVTIDANKATHALTLGTNEAFQIHNIAFQNGLNGGTVGGGLLQSGASKLELFNCTFNNGSALFGGAIATANAQTLTLTDCIVENSDATGASGDGGGIFAFSGSDVTLIRTTLRNNSANDDGGGLFLTGGSLLVVDSTIHNNTTDDDGAGISLVGTPNASGYTVRNSTISSNIADFDGGGIAWTSSSGTLRIQNSTVFFNFANGGVGGGVSIATGTGILDIESSIVSNNFNSGGTAPDIDNPNTTKLKTSAVFSNLGFAKTDLGGNLAFGTSLGLAALANNGGATITHLPNASSPLINAGSNPAGIASDQRTLPRSIGKAPDIGAVETFDGVVRNANDSGGDSLREAVNVANLVSGANAITFDAAVFTAPQTITLTTGELAIIGDLTITGPATGVTISGNNAVRVFNLTDSFPQSFTLSNLTLTQGRTSGFGGAILGAGDTITLTNCTLSENVAFNAGGGAVALIDGGSLTATNTKFTGNSANGFGGAIDLFGNGFNTLNLLECTVSGNSAGAAGGIYVQDRITLLGTTVSGNVALNQGGGMMLNGYFATGLSLGAVIANSTISGNSAGDDGGGIALAIFTGGILLSGSTITDNATPLNAGNLGGGIFLSSGTGIINFDSTIIQGNAANAGPDVFTTGKVDAQNSLLGSKSGITALTTDTFTNANIGVGAKLGPLQNNGGPTLTHLPSFDSPALSNGHDFFGLPTDQRGAGFLRNSGGAIDIGAVEVPVFVVTNTNDAGAGSLRQAVIDANATAGVDTIIFDPSVFAAAKTITLTTGQLTITEGVIVDGPGKSLLTISGNNSSRIFNIDGPGAFEVAIQDLTLTNGSTASNGGAIRMLDEFLTVSNVVIQGGKANFGAAISSLDSGSITIENSSITGNTVAIGGGGAIEFASAGSLLVRGSTFQGNNNVMSLGKITNLLLENSTFTGNSGANGTITLLSGIPATATLAIRNVTISGNTSTSSTSAAGITLASPAPLSIVNTTITNNSGGAGTGGVVINFGTGTLNLESTIVSGNTGTTTADVARLGGTLSIKTSAIGTAPFKGFTDLSGNLAFGTPLLLGPLANNGGPTLTHALAFNSPAVNAGSNPESLATDQRGPGFLREAGGKADIGAFEFGTPAVTSFLVNEAQLQRSRLTVIEVFFGVSVSAADFTNLGAITLTRTLATSPSGIGTVVQTGATGASGLISVAQGQSNSIRLTFSNANGDGTSAGVQFGSLADGRWQLKIGSSNFTSVLNDPLLRRLFGDINGDGTVDGPNDFAQFGSVFGTTAAGNPFDFNNDSTIDGANDFAQFGSRFGLTL